MKQKAFTLDFVKKLDDCLQDYISYYEGEDDFPIAPEDVVELHFEGHDNLLHEMLPYLSSQAQIEVDAAIKLYEAFRDLTPLEASYRPFWLYLSHVELFTYMKKRWPVEEAKNKETHILDHWFYSSGKLRSHLEGMYWLVRMSVKYDASGTPDYTYTRFLFSRRVLGDRGIAVRKVFQKNDKIFKGILEYIMKNENTLFQHHMQARAIYCAKLLNAKSQVIELSTWDEEDVEKFLNLYRTEISLQDND